MKMTSSCLQVLHDCFAFARLYDNSFNCWEVWKDVGQLQFYCRSSNAVFQREYILNYCNFVNEHFELYTVLSLINEQVASSKACKSLQHM